MFVLIALGIAPAIMEWLWISYSYQFFPRDLARIHHPNRITSSPACQIEFFFFLLPILYTLVGNQCVTNQKGVQEPHLKYRISSIVLSLIKKRPGREYVLLYFFSVLTEQRNVQNKLPILYALSCYSGFFIIYLLIISLFQFCIN